MTAGGELMVGDEGVHVLKISHVQENEKNLSGS